MIRRTKPQTVATVERERERAIFLHAMENAI